MARLVEKGRMPSEPDILSWGRIALERAIDRLPLYLKLRPAAPNPIESAAGNRAFQFLIHLAQDLIGAGTVAEALERTLDVAFQALPVHRGFVMLRHDGGLRCEITRLRDRVEHRPSLAATPGSETIIQRVMSQRVGLYTRDALSDERLGSSDSTWRHGIRAAMCVPLWSGEDVIGVLQVDSPVLVGTFSEHDLDFLMALANLAATAVERIREREIRLRLQRYHAPAMVEQVMREAGGPPRERPLGHAEVTVLFADLANFTGLSESMPLEQVADMLSGFCRRVTDAAFAEGGTVDKFIGDCVMVFFGAPVAMPDHARRAVRAARHVHTALDIWNRERVSAGLAPLRARVGLNSGPVIVGDIGSAERLDYTVIGNTVNIAARLQQQVAEPGDIVLGESTRQQLPPDTACEPLGKVTLRGLEHGIAAFRMRAPAPESGPAAG